MTEYAINYFKDKVEPNKKFKLPSSVEKSFKIGNEAKKEIDKELNPEEIQTIIYSVGKENGYDKKLRDWFKMMLSSFVWEEDGPRMGFFVSFFGLKETINLIEDKIK